jgi:hypothetical protein
LDKSKSGGRREDEEEIDLTNQDEVAKLRKEFLGEPPDTRFDEARKHNAQVMQAILHSLDVKINSRWILGKDKDFFKLFRYILVQQKEMADIISSTNESISIWAYSIKQTLFNLFLEIELTRGLTEKNIGTVKSRMDKILESPVVKQLESIMHDNEEALKKLDKTRQQILDDTIV